MNWFRDKSGKIWADCPRQFSYSLNTERIVNHPGLHVPACTSIERRFKMASAKVIAAAEALLAALKADTPAAAARPTGNRTTAGTNYRAGSNLVQDVVDSLRQIGRAHV